MLSAIIAITLLAAFFGMVLGISAIIFKVKSNPIVDEIDKLLPQTQCTQCTYAGCRPYAEAIAKGEAPINLCPPGGEQTIHALADLLDVEVLPAPEDEGPKEPTVAVIIEEQCIGCTLCIQACPVDAIVGAAKQMHTVIESECTGCDLCLAPCPVDCIIMKPLKDTPITWKWPLPQNHANHPLLVSKTATVLDKSGAIG
jgi:H+/Na+-translocating ferredoxin:NAD+ oxidoreductase subunit B